ncbi:uncharacterized protein LOC100904189 [Galendromus occidentalis]|uniref:XK-related protein n=1 Tax=Galendromus occidentalis TaxID=34638 RepID=A0AAJ6QV62_9ACAR|nr:uncharacterized protein LOC100904189 [Galendromus occidentalis]
MDSTPKNQRRPEMDGGREDEDRAEEWEHEVPQFCGSDCRCVFSFLLIEAAVHLGIYLNKMFEDSTTTKEYYRERQTLGLIISVVCLIAPTLIYTVYETLRSVLSEHSLRDILTKMVKGLLLIPWQIKAHIDLLHFAAAQACSWRPLETKEKQYLSKIRQDAFVLEFFVDFYAGFFQLLLQLHFLVAMVATENTHGRAFYTEILASSLAVLSLIKGLQRKDDGCLTKSFSYLGWTCFCASRVIAFALLSAVISYWVLVVLLLHATVATVFIFRIVKRVRRELRAKAIEDGRQSSVPRRENNGVLATLCFFQFGLPSLMYWPMMFEFKKRIYITLFFIVSFSENVLCLVFWLAFKNEDVNQELGKRFVVAVVGLTTIGILAIVLYVCCKPDRTDEVALSHIRETNSNKYGIFFDFCNAVQILPDTSEIDLRREQIARLRPDL